jgi:rod shape determining protein RodA
MGTKTVVKVPVIREENVIKKMLNSSNWRMISIVMFLTLIGIVMIYSATFSTSGSVYVTKQLFAFLLGLFLMFLFSLINYQLFQPYHWYIYFICVFLLILTLLVGSVYRGTRAWINFNFFLLQPSEIVRIFYILFLCGYFDKNFQNVKLSKFFVASLSFLIIAGLILLQPDFSAIVVYFPIIIVSFYLGGVNKKLLSYLLLFFFTTIVLFLTKIYLTVNKEFVKGWFTKFVHLSLQGFNLQFFIMLLIILLIVCFISWLLKKLLFRVKIEYVLLTIFVLWLSYTGVTLSHKFVKIYQQKRIISFLDPYFDPTGSGYQVIQTKIAIGSGRLFGKGLFKSTQAKLGFVPEKHTDFIFSLISEELGFVGASVVMLLLFLFILEGIKIVFTSRDTYGGLLAATITSMFTFYFVVNIGMCLGLMPVIGIPLPFVSYGGSNLVASYMAVGILNSVYIRRYIY